VSAKFAARKGAALQITDLPVRLNGKATSQGCEHVAVARWQGSQCGRWRVSLCTLPPGTHPPNISLLKTTTPHSRRTSRSRERRCQVRSSASLTSTYNVGALSMGSYEFNATAVMLSTWSDLAASDGACAPAAVPGAWLRVQRCWSMRSFPNARCANGC
jgi:hypothetical protein